MGTTQRTITEYGTRYELGDCLEDTASRSDGKKLILRECPLCLADPTRERHLFRGQESRPAHFRREHDADEV
jgi:hypothetical protein